MRSAAARVPSVTKNKEAVPDRIPVAVTVGGHRAAFRDGVHLVGDAEVCTALNDDGDGALRLEWSVRNPGRAPLVLDRVSVRLGVHPRRVLEQGWQSWSAVRRCAPEDVRPERRLLPAWRKAMFAADPERLGSTVAGDGFLVDDSGLTGFLSTGGHLGTVATDGDGLDVVAHLDGVVLEPGSERPLDSVWLAAGDPGARYSRFAERWGARAGARATASSPLGWCSWYHHWGKVSPSQVGAAIDEGRRHALDVVQVDDGYQPAVGDWLSPSPSWPDGVSPIAREIREAGMQAGIWTAPFLTLDGSDVARRHPEWLLRDGNGRPVLGMDHPKLWGGAAFALDVTHPGVQDHLTATFAALVDDGFTYFKCDFLYAGALAGRHSDRSLTRAQTLRRGLDAVRRGIGDQSFLLACGCPLAPAVGVADAMRVSPDVAPYWHRPGTLAGFDETNSGARNAIRASVLRAPLHRRLWINDPDCVLLRPTDTDLGAHHRALLADVVAGVGGLAVLSDDLDLYGDEEWDAVDRLRAIKATTDAPLDIVDPFASVVEVRSPGSILRVDWRGDGAASLELTGNER